MEPLPLRTLRSFKEVDESLGLGLRWRQKQGPRGLRQGQEESDRPSSGETKHRARCPKLKGCWHRRPRPRIAWDRQGLWWASKAKTGMSEAQYQGP